MAWEVPSWLQPPSESERRRLELMEEEVKAKASSMLRKSVGMARMQEEAAKLTATGMDELTARKKALLDNASLIFADEPEALSKLLHSEQALAIQERSAASLEKWREAQAEGIEGRLAQGEANLDFKYRSLEARQENWDRVNDLREQSQDALEAYRSAQIENSKLTGEERSRHNQKIEELREKAQGSQELYNKARMELAKQRSEFEGRFSTATNPVTGKLEAVWQSSPGRQQLVQQPSFATDSSVKKMEARVQAVNALKAAEASGDPVAIEQARLRLESIEHAQGYNKPTFDQQEAIKALYNDKNDIEQKLLLYSIAPRTPQNEPLIKALEKRRDEIQAEIRKITARPTDAKPAPKPSAGGTNRIGRFNVITR